MNNITPAKKAGKPEIIILILLIAIQLACSLYGMIFIKDSLFIDEIAAFSLTNSSEKPFLNGTDFTKSSDTDFWITGAELRDYLTVAKDNRFDYATVWRNQTYDFTPPMFYLLLHTVCSLFPGVFSFWFGYIINLAAAVAADLALYALIRRISGSGTAALLSVFWYGLTLGVQCGTVFIRCYELNVAFVILYAAILYRMFDAEKPALFDFIALFLTALCGSLTHNTFLIFAFFLTAIICLILLLRKRIRNLLSIGLTAAAGVGLGLLLFPATLTHFFAATDKESSQLFLFSLDTYQIRNYMYLLYRLLLFDTAGLRISVFPSGNYVYFVAGAVFLLAMFMPVAFLFRRNPHLRAFLRAARDKFVQTMRHSRFFLLTVLLAGVGYLFILGISLPDSVRLPLMNLTESCDRFIYLLIPFVCGGAVMILRQLILLLPLRKHPALPKRLAAVLPLTCIAAALLLQHSRGNNHFLYRSEISNGHVHDYVKGADCIVLVNSPNIQNLALYMTMDADDVFFSIYRRDHYQEEQAELEKARDSSDPVYLLFDLSLMYSEAFYENQKEFLMGEKAMTADEIIDYQPVLSYFTEMFGTEPEFCTRELIGGTEFRLFRLK